MSKISLIKTLSNTTVKSPKDKRLLGNIFIKELHDMVIPEDVIMALAYKFDVPQLDLMLENYKPRQFKEY